jgi:predicted membrane metal-binding protein
MLRLRLRIALAAAVVRTRPYHVGLAALSVGLLLGPAPRTAAPLAAMAALALLAGCRAPGLGVLSAVLIVGGAALGVTRIEAQDRSALSARPPGPITVPATLAEAPRPSPFGARVALELARGPAAGEQVMAYTDREVRWPAEAGPGLEAEVSGLLRRPKSKPNADFDWPAYLRRRSISFELRVDRLELTGRRRGGLRGIIDAARRRAERGISAGLSPPHVALARGMVLGQDERVAEADREDFRRSGLAHILTVVLLVQYGPPTDAARRLHQGLAGARSGRGAVHLASRSARPDRGLGEIPRGDHRRGAHRPRPVGGQKRASWSAQSPRTHRAR